MALKAPAIGFVTLRGGMLELGLLGLALALMGGCITAESVAAKLGKAQLDAAGARSVAEDRSVRGDRAAAVASAVAALGALREAQAWVDAYVTAHGRSASAQFEPALRRIADEADAAKAAALRAGATPDSIEAEANRLRSRAQSGGGGGGGGGGGAGGGAEGGGGYCGGRCQRIPYQVD